MSSNESEKADLASDVASLAAPAYTNGMARTGAQAVGDRIRAIHSDVATWSDTSTGWARQQKVLSASTDLLHVSSAVDDHLRSVKTLRDAAVATNEDVVLAEDFAREIRAVIARISRSIS